MYDLVVNLFIENKTGQAIYNYIHNITVTRKNLLFLIERGIFRQNPEIDSYIIAFNEDINYKYMFDVAEKYVEPKSVLSFLANFWQEQVSNKIYISKPFTNNIITYLELYDYYKWDGAKYFYKTFEILNEEETKNVFYYAYILLKNFTDYTVNIIEDTFNLIANMIYYDGRGEYINDYVHFHDVFLNANFKIRENANDQGLNRDTNKYEVEKRIARALLYYDLIEQDEDHIKILLRIVSKPLQSDISRFLKKNVTRKIDYSQVIDVHENQRDKKTTEALSEFMKEQITAKEVDKYFNEFWEARNNLTENQKNALLRVLGVDDDLKDSVRNVKDFGGLLTQTISFYDIIIDPKEFIARMWKFASFYDAKENLKLSVQLAIINSLQGTVGNKRVVCNPGKIQQLVVSILQGRFKMKNGKYVDIDGYMYLDEGKENRVIKKEGIKDLGEIHHYLNNFMSQIFSIEETRPKTALALFSEVYKYINNLAHGEVPGYDNVLLEPNKVVFYFCFVTIDNKGVKINPELSIMSNYDDMFSVNDVMG